MTTKGQKLVWHGLSRRRAAASWYAMWRRVKGKTKPYRENYADRGITVCQRWESLACFIEDMGDCPPGLTLERINTNGHYEPGNCVWADRLVQINNRRNSMTWVIAGVEYSSARAAAAANGVVEATIRRWCGVHAGSFAPRTDCKVIRRYNETLAWKPVPTKDEVPA